MNEKLTLWHLTNYWSLLKKLTGLTMLALLFPLMSFSQYTNATGGWNGGGVGNNAYNQYYSGGGGGASDIRIGGTLLANRVIVAGGGGGGGYNGGNEYGGKGGGLTGEDGKSYNGTTVTGYGGTQIAGGAATAWPGWNAGTPGSLGIGGDAASGTGGGGGGGGYYGGGGASWCGGGGGSSYASGICSSVVHTQGYQTGDGQVIISGSGFGTQTFNYTGAVQTFIVPSGVTSVTVDIKGGKGGGSFYVPSTFWDYGGLGGRVTANISVSAGQTLNIYVGQKGQNGGQYVFCSITSSVSSQTNVSCNGGSNGSATISASGETTPYTYAWSPSGGTNATASGLAAGTYTCTITSANLCTKTQTVTITQPTVLTATTSQTNVSCNGGANGSATVVASGGAGAYTYAWSPSGGTGTTASGLSAGSYTCTITDANACSITKSFTISQPSALIVTPVSQTNISCNGGSNGAASVSVSGGTAAYTYNWTPGNPTGDGTASATGLTAGTWTCTVTDANSCTATRSFTITQPTALTALVLSQTNVSCNGGSNGAASVSVSGGTTAYSYNWTPGNPTGDGTASVTGLTSGTWICTVTDANSCTTTQSFTVTQPSALVLTPASQTNIACNGGSTGSASVNAATGGTSAYTYNWTPGNPTGDGTLSVTGLTAGTWICTVTDANGCTATQSFTVTQPTALSLIASSQTNVSCFGGSNGAASVTAATGGAGGYTYNWTPGNPTGDGTVSVTGLTAGTWICTATDANGCTTTQSFTVTQPSGLVLTAASQTNIACNGGSTGAASVNAATGGTGTKTYNWTPGNPTGDGTVSVTGLTAGTWICTVTDANGCTANQSFTVTQPSGLVLTAASQTNIACNGGSTGAASVNAATGGTGTKTYNWTPGNPSGDGTISVTGLTAGTWTCTVTDANGCTTFQSFTLTQPSVLAATTSQTNVSCNSGSNGSATVVVSGGVSAYTYAWSPSGGTAATTTGRAAGVYTCTITDANACTLSKSFTITQPSALAATTSQTNVSCNGGSNGSATVVVSGGVSAYTYAWSPSGGTAATTTGRAAGVYTCTITDANACTLSKSFTITQPSALAATTSQTNVSCNGGSNGSATVVVSGGVSAYTYAWSPSGGTVATASGLSAGAYSCTITDANGCTLVKSFTITQPTGLTATASQVNVICIGGNNGSASVVASGGTAAYSYAWSPGGGTAATASGLTVGNYSCTITDANLCSIIKSFSIIQSDLVNPVAIAEDVTIYLNSTGNASITASEINNGSTDNCSIASLSASKTDFTCADLGTNNVTLTVTDASGNSSTAVSFVTVKDNLSPVADLAILSDITGECSASVIAPTATDNCVGTVTATTSDPLAYDAQGSYIIHWTYSDGNGNSSTQEQNVIVADVTAPVADMALLPDVTSECIASVTAPTATDNCVGAVTATTSDPLAYDAQGSYIIHWTYSDGNGNTSTQEQNVIVADVTAPVADMALLPDVTSECIASVTAPTATDNCVGVVTATTSDPLAYDAQGSYIIHWTYSDGNGNSSTQEQNVIVADVTAPVADMALLPDVINECIASVTAPTATDNCVGAVTATTSDPLAYDAQGSYIIHWTYSDGNGNTSTQEQNVLVADVTAPVADKAILSDVTGECSASAIAPTATDNCAGVITATTSDPLSYEVQGSYLIHWTYSDGNGNSSTQEQNVIVADVTAPVADAAILSDVTGECSASAIAPTATDNCAGVITATTSDPLSYEVQGSYLIHWTYSDGNGNSSTQEQNVIVADVTAPSIVCNNDTTVMAIGINGHYSVVGSTFDPKSVADNCSLVTLVNDLTNSNTLDGAILPEGANAVTWTATDESGNSYTCTTTVTVEFNVGVPELNYRNVSVFPNPSKGMFMIEVPSSCTAVVYDVRGRILKTQKMVDNLNQVDLTKCQQGVYLLKLIKDKQVVNVKLIVE